MLNRRVYASDRFDWQKSVTSIEDTPPGSPTKGDRHIVGTSPTGAWVGHDNEIAEWSGSEWLYIAPLAGFTVAVVSAGTLYYFNTTWTTIDSVLEKGSLSAGTGVEFPSGSGTDRLLGSGGLVIGTTAASTTVAGHVTTSAQVFAGLKDFNDGIRLRGTSAAYSLDLEGQTASSGQSNAIRFIDTDQDEVLLYKNGVARLYTNGSFSVAGSLGVGILAPSRPLHVVADTNTGTLAEMRMANLGTAPAALSLQNTISTAGSRIVRIRHDADALTFGFWNESTGNLTREVMRMQQDGNVGLGTTSPSAQFEVVANQARAIQTTLYSNSNDSGRYMSLRARGTESSPINVGSGDRLLLIQVQGYGGGDWRNAAFIQATSEGTFSSSSAPTNLSFSTATAGSTSPTERMRIAAGGNVGIGLTNPLALLHVNGNIRTQGVYQVGTSSGITASRSWYDANTFQQHSVQITGGIITSWTVT